MNSLVLGKPLRRAINEMSKHSLIRNNISCSIDYSVFRSTLDFVSLSLELDYVQWCIVGQYIESQIYYELADIR